MDIGCTGIKPAAHGMKPNFVHRSANIIAPKRDKVNDNCPEPMLQKNLLNHQEYREIHRNIV